jgi:acetolactate synthase-1/3 small subunit
MERVEQQTIVALVLDRPGVLNRVVSMVRRRGFNITSLAVGHAESPGLSRMTFVVEGDAPTIEQVTKQLRKLIDVVKVTDLSGENTISRELALMRVKATPSTRSEIIQMVDIFRANIVDVAHDSLIIEVTGDQDKLDSLCNLLKPFGVREIMRSGRLAMVRGEPGAGNGKVRRASKKLVSDEELEPQQPAFEPPS